MAFLKDHLKSFVAMILCFTLIFSSFALAFADSEEEAATSSEEASSEALPSSALLATVTDEDEIALDNAMRELSVKLAAASSSDLTATDIYNLLLTFRTFYNTTAQFKVYNQSVLDEINSLETWLQTYLLNIQSELYITNGSTHLSVGDCLFSLVYELTDDGGQSGVRDNFESALSLLGTISNNISSFNTYTVGGVTYTLPELQYNSQNFARLIHNNVSDIKTVITNMNASLTSFISANHSDLTAIDSSVDDFASANHNDLTSIDTSISDFADDFNFVDWVQLSNGYTAYNAAFQELAGGTVSGTHYVVYNFSSGLSPNQVLKITLPFRWGDDSQSSNINFSYEIGFLYNNTFYSYGDYLTFTSYDNNLFNICIYCTPVARVNSKLCIKFTTNQVYNYSSQFSNIAVFGISSSSQDYYTVYDSILLFNQNKVLDKFEYLYASDDLIEAKDAQQAQEDAALEEFTGGGSAAASVNDIGSAKDVSSGLKNGLSSGGSASAPIGVMQSNSGFWDWFSSETMGNLDNTQNNRSLRSSGGEEYIDFYSRNWEQIQDYLGGNR